MPLAQGKAEKEQAHGHMAAQECVYKGKARMATHDTAYMTTKRAIPFRSRMQLEGGMRHMAKGKANMRLQRAMAEFRAMLQMLRIRTSSR